MSRLGRLSKTAIAAMALTVWASNSQAQDWFVLDPLRWEATLTFDGRRLVTEGSEAANTFAFEESVSFLQTGYVLDRRIGNFSISLQPSFTQDFASGSRSAEESQAHALNFNISANAFQGTPGQWGGSVAASRASGTSDGDLGSRSEFVSQNRTATLNWKTTIFPSSLTYSERLSESLFRSGLSMATSSRDEKNRAITFRGSSSKMDVLAERRWRDSTSGLRNITSITDKAQFRHTTRWGKGSSYVTQSLFTRRQGFQEVLQFTSSQALHLQHLKNLSTDYRYGFSRTEQAITTVGQNASFGANYSLYRNITANLNLSGSKRSSEIARNTTYGARGSVTYRKKIPWNGNLTAGVGGGAQVIDQRSDRGLGEVTDERQVVPPSGIVTLDQRFIVPSTIIVTDGDQNIVFVQGTDYDISAAASNFTELVIPDGGLIQNLPDKVILVSYDFEPLSTKKFLTTPFDYQLALDFGPVSIFHNGSQTRESLLDGIDDGSLIDRTQTSTGIRARWSKGRTSASASAAYRTSASGDFTSSSLSFNQTASHRFSSGISLRASAGQSFSESSSRTSELYSASIRSSWQPRTNLRLNAGLSGWFRSQSGNLGSVTQRDANFIRGTIALSWYFRKVRFSLRYEHNRRDTGSFVRNEDRVELVLTRRSF